MKTRAVILLSILTMLAAPRPAQAQLRLGSPVEGETIHSNRGEVPVVVLGAPPEARFLVLLDGAPYGEVRSAPRFVLGGIDRGAHRLQVTSVDNEGSELDRTEAVEFYVWQASRLFPNRQGAR